MVPTLRKLREEWGTHSRGSADKFKGWGTRQAVKLGFTQRWRTKGLTGQFWQRRFYDFNVWTQRKEVEKLKYMHRNPVVRGLVAKPEDWRWSSYRSYAYGEDGLVRINDWKWWEKKIRDKTGVKGS